MWLPDRFSLHGCSDYDAGAAIGSRVYPSDLAEIINDYYREQGVELMPGQTITGVERSADAYRVTLRDEKSGGEEHLTFAGVVAGLGITPNTSLAEDAGLAVDNGIIVDELLRTSDESVYAAGDVASFHNPTLGRRMRVEHEDSAKTMGRAAGRNMAGERTPYDHLPFFYSDLFELGYEAVGEVDSRLETHSDWSEPYRKGFVYYLRDGHVRGVLLWNVFGQVDAARRLIAEPGPFSAADLKGRLREKVKT